MRSVFMRDVQGTCSGDTFKVSTEAVAGEVD